jgi:hypothetical protein
MPKLTKQKIEKRRSEIKNNLSELIEKNKLGFSFADIEKIILEENGQKDFNKLVFLFLKNLQLSDVNETNNLVQAVNDAWNYFPHQSLGGLSPAEKAETKIVSKKLRVEKDRDELWGDDGPYSQVTLVEETRILDDRVSRVFLIVEVTVNPFTYKLCLKNKKYFKGDEVVLQFLEHAENRGFKDGYVAVAFQEELAGEKTFEKAVIHKKYAEEGVIRMHKFVMKELLIPESPAFKMKIK